MSLSIATHIPVSVLQAEPDEVIATYFELLDEEAEKHGG